MGLGLMVPIGEGSAFGGAPRFADMAEMARKGYRAVSMQQYELPMFGIDYRTVTYQRADRSDS